MSVIASQVAGLSFSAAAIANAAAAGVDLAGLAAEANLQVAELITALRALASVLPSADANLATIANQLLALQALGQFAFNNSANSGHVLTLLVAA